MKNVHGKQKDPGRGRALLRRREGVEDPGREGLAARDRGEEAVGPWTRKGGREGGFLDPATRYRRGWGGGVGKMVDAKNP